MSENKVDLILNSAEKLMCCCRCTFFPSDSTGMRRELKLYAQVLETCLIAEQGSFDFLFTPVSG